MPIPRSYAEESQPVEEIVVTGSRIQKANVTASSPVTQIGAEGLIERVDVLTGGASSVYGSDAIAGVVNFILRDDFQGVKLDYQFSQYMHENDNGEMQDRIADAGYEVPSGTEYDGDISEGFADRGREPRERARQRHRLHHVP